MNDERNHLGEEHMEQESGFCGYLDVTDVVGLGTTEPAYLEPISDNLKMGDEVEEQKRKSLPSVGMGRGSDDDERPIGSLFKVKKPRAGKKGKPLVAEARAENPRDEKGDSDGFYDTLASFKKKLKRPKRAKGACDAGSGVEKVSSSSGGVKVPARMEDSGLDAPLEDAGKSGRKIPESDSEKKNEKKGISVSHESSGHSSDVSLEDSVSALVNKAHSCSVQRTRLVSKKRKEIEINTSTENELKQSANKVSADSSSPVVEAAPSLDGRLSSPADGARQGLFARRRGRKPHGAPVTDMMEVSIAVVEGMDQTSNDEMLEEKMPVVVGKTRTSIRKGRAGTQKPLESRRSSSRTVKESLPVQESSSFFHPKVRVESTRHDAEGFDRSAEKDLDSSEPSLLQSLNSDSVLETKKTRPAATEEDGLGRFIRHSGKLIQNSHETSDDILPHQVKEKMLEDSSNQFSTGNVSHLMHKVAELSASDPISTWTGNVVEFRPCSQKVTGTSPSQSKDVTFDSTHLLVQDSPTVQAVKMSEECAESGNALNQIIGGASRENPLMQIQRKEIVESLDNDPTDDLCEETMSKDTVMRTDGLNLPSKEAFGKPSPHTERVSSVLRSKQLADADNSDVLLGPCSENLKESLRNSLDENTESSTPEKMDVDPNDGIKEEYDSLSYGVSLLDGDKKAQDIHKYGDDLDPPRDVPLSVKSQPLPVTMQLEEKLEPGDGLPSSNVSISVLSSQGGKQPALSSAIDCKDLPATGESLHQFVEDNLLEDLDDAPKEPSSARSQYLLVTKDSSAAFSRTNLLDLKETYQVGAAVISDHDNADNQLGVPRVMRHIKRRRHGDMAYEGDVDWEVLMHEQGLFTNTSTDDGNRSVRAREKSDSHSNILEEVGNSRTAAVAAGLKARAVTPIEKIKFKDVLKRKGGLQEYLDCRNLILGRWSKDVKHILPLVDCGVSDTPSEDESPRDSLIREIYMFLDRNGYINAGIASEKETSDLPGLHHSEVPKKLKPKKTYGVKTTGSELEVPLVQSYFKVSENAEMMENDMPFLVQNTKLKLDSEVHENNNLHSSGSGSELSSLVKLNEQTVGCMELNVQSACRRCETETFNSVKFGNNMCTDWDCNPRSGYSNVIPDDQEIQPNDPQAKPHGCPICVSSSKIIGHEPNPDVSLKQIEDFCDMHQSVESKRENIAYIENRVAQSTLRSFEVDNGSESDLKVSKRIIIVGAGPAGLTAARHLQRQGFSVTVLEARDRIGGRVYTDRKSLSVPVDLGASIITGVEADVATERRPDPSSLICKQLGLELTVLNSDCPLYDIVTGHKVPAELDDALEAEYNSLLDDMVVLVAQNGEGAMRMSLEDGLEYALRRRRTAQLTSAALDFDQVKMDCNSGMINTVTNASMATEMTNAEDSLTTDILSPLERRVMDWHFANLEYGCAALLKEVSLPYWNQDDVYGGFGGAHCMIKGGYSTIIESLGKGLDIHLNQIVTEVVYDMKDSGEVGQQQNKVKVSTSNGGEFVGDAVLITVPLGCLKADSIKFSPPLPEWKKSSIQRLGFGVLNKVVLEFPKVFWDDTVDYFGATAEETSRRGQCFMFWNVRKTVGAPVLIALVVGKAAIDGQCMNTSDHVNHALMVLRKLFGKATVPDPVAAVVTNWGMDPFTRGAYSYVAIGASGEDYDILGRPVSNCLFFSGEATCKEHPDTVGGAMMSGLREAVRIIDIFTTGKDYVAEVDAMEPVQQQADSERNEVRDMSKRLDACKLSNVLCKNSDGMHALPTKESLLQDMFSSAKTTSGRLHLAKELFRLPVETLKSFAGTKEGLSILNTWILDSLGKNATQLLRHCVRLLVLVSTDLLAVRLSGIGRTVKEKVCVHTSRDIRAIASQLVSVWIEVFRKEKATNGGLKLLRQTTTSESSKVRSKELMSGKPPLRMANEALDSKGNLQVPSSARTHSPSTPNNKKFDGRIAKLEPIMDTNSEVNSSCSQRVIQESKLEGNVVMSEEEAAAFAAAEAARSAALKAAEAFASSEAEVSALRELPKIPSFHKFARREQYAQMEESDIRKKWSGGILGRQDCVAEIDSRNCRVRNWSVDFTATCANLDNSKLSGDNYTQRSYSNEMACPSNLREHSGESGAIDSRWTKAWVDTDTAGSVGVKDSLAIERWQSQAMDADADFYNQMHIKDEEDSNKMSTVSSLRHQRHIGGSTASQVADNRSSLDGQPRGIDHIKQGVVDYVASLLMPLYKTRKIDREGYKSIMKKTATKVMEQCTEAEKGMAVYEFLDSKRKHKIRSFVDKLIERHMAMNQKAQS
ncbi:lysine-specific histone demethylase 1 homolog 3 [Elaeis guineensis]|uniref:Lysine-specific histone demethylase 1 homolog 3 isoform X1 n=1 Tax=Elaeis guineensis var. tenera TaxID=51953 RepID=A0A6I9R254_ELAGV|nr:lysine-specific histone demethylase 1 homolog 3 isoform X1 [Elaeis guineensis]